MSTAEIYRILLALNSFYFTSSHFEILLYRRLDDLSTYLNVNSFIILTFLPSLAKWRQVKGDFLVPLTNPCHNQICIQNFSNVQNQKVVSVKQYASDK